MKDDSWDGEAVQSAAIPAGGATRLCDALSERALSVLDGMSVCEVAWLEGGSLPETIYACLYFHPIAYSAMLRDLGWNPPPRGSDGVGAVAMDLDIGEGAPVRRKGGKFVGIVNKGVLFSGWTFKYVPAVILCIFLMLYIELR